MYVLDRCISRIAAPEVLVSTPEDDNYEGR